MAGSALRRVALVYHPHAIGPLELAAAASGVCQFIWVLDTTDPALSPLLPLLRRLGPVVDTTGRTEAEVVGEVAELGPSGVTTSVQFRLAAAIAARCGIKYHSPATAAVLNDKLYQRQALQTAGMEVPWFAPVPDARQEWPGFASGLRYPLVLKPRDSRGSRSTASADDPAALLALLDAIADGSDGLSADIGGYIVEGRIDPRHPGGGLGRVADVLMVDSVVRAGRVEHLAVIGHFVQAPPFRGTGSFAPAPFDQALTAELLAAVDAALGACGIVDGFTNTDLILTPDGCRVLEVNGRVGGEVPELFELCGRPGLLRETLRFALGEPEVSVDPLTCEGVAFSITVQPPLGVGPLERIEGLEAVSALPEVRDVVLQARPGDRHDWRSGTNARLATVRGVAADHEALERLDHVVRQLVRGIFAPAG